MSTESLVHKLSSMGLSADVIADLLEEAPSKVRGTISIKRHIRPPEEELLAERMRRLANFAIDRAWIMLQFGPPQQQLSIIKSVLTAAGKLIGQESSGSTEEARAALEGMLRQMTDTPKSTTVVTETSIRDVIPGTPALPAYDQD